MKKWTCLDSVLISGDQTLSLNEHDGEYAIRVGAAELMSTRRHASEEKAAELACEHASRIPAARILIGGLGFGFTLKAALNALRSDASVMVAEIFPAVVAWNRNRAYPLAAEALADPRVKVLQEDVLETIRESPGRFDGIVMDVDNGPAALTADANRRLYEPEGLRATRAALRPAGCVAYWSAFPDSAFEKALARTGLAVEVHRCRAHGNSGSRHVIFVGRVKS